MSKVLLSQEDWIYLYSELASYVEGRLCAFDNTTHDLWGNRLPETENQFCEIVTDVEGIMEKVLEKEES